jgi:hypothetical protein
VLDKLSTVDDHGRLTIKENPPIAQRVANVALDDLHGLVGE